MVAGDFRLQVPGDGVLEGAFLDLIRSFANAVVQGETGSGGAAGVLRTDWPGGRLAAGSALGDLPRCHCE